MDFSACIRIYEDSDCEFKEQKSVVRRLELFVFFVLRKYWMDSSFYNLPSAGKFGLQGCVVTAKVWVKCEDEEES